MSAMGRNLILSPPNHARSTERVTFAARLMIACWLLFGLPLLVGISLYAESLWSTFPLQTDESPDYYFACRAHLRVTCGDTRISTKRALPSKALTFGLAGKRSLTLLIHGHA